MSERFHNPWPDSEPPGLRMILRWARERRRKTLAPNPPFGSQPTATPRIAYPRNGDGELTATWIGHSSILLQMHGLNILFDPVFGSHAFPAPLAFPRLMPPGLNIDALPPLDIVLHSHNHFDHMDRAAVKRIARKHPGVTWVVPLRVGHYLKGWGARDIHELAWYQDVTVKGVKITGTPARHFSGRRLIDRNHSHWSGFALEIAGRRVLFVGDTAYHPEFGQVGSKCGPFDLVMIPAGAYEPQWFMTRVHVNPEEAVRIYQDLVAAHPQAPLPVMLPVHWGTFRLTDEPVEEPPRKTAECWASRALPESLLWIPRCGETRAIGGQDE